MIISIEIIIFTILRTKKTSDHYNQVSRTTLRNGHFSHLIRENDNMKISIANYNFYGS